MIRGLYGSAMAIVCWPFVKKSDKIQTVFSNRIRSKLKLTAEQKQICEDFLIDYFHIEI